MATPSSGPMPPHHTSRLELLCAVGFLAAVTVILTWPQALHLATRVPDHDDPFLSMWRLGWIAHALRTDVRHLFDGNIFHPHLRTLAFSDATLLEGLLAAPWLWAHVNPVSCTTYCSSRASFRLASACSCWRST